MLIAFRCNLDSTSYIFVNKNIALVNPRPQDTDSLAESLTGSFLWILLNHIYWQYFYLIVLLTDYVIFLGSKLNRLFIFAQSI